MFIDTIELTLSSGNGGAGCVSFRREKFVPNGGPDGGDGGKGGNVYFIASNNSDTLSWYKGKKHLKANNGKPGMGSNKSGKQGDHLELIVPTGTQVIDAVNNEVLLDLVDNGQRELFIKGGKGGLGNVHFKNSRNQAPTYAQTGIQGESYTVKLVLKLIADVGLVGFPNVGKSTLISVVSNAKPQIADYEFTTITPNLGIVNVDDYSSFVLADIPGIIEGASDGKGLGFSFLRHIERTRFLLFMIDVANYRDTNEQLTKLITELKNYSLSLYSKPFAIVLTKIDTLSQPIEELLTTFLQLQQYPKSYYEQKNDYQGYFLKADAHNLASDTLPAFILPISSITHNQIDILKWQLYQLIQDNKKNL